MLSQIFIVAHKWQMMYSDKPMAKVPFDIDSGQHFKLNSNSLQSHDDSAFFAEEVCNIPSKTIRGFFFLHSVFITKNTVLI